MSTIENQKASDEAQREAVLCCTDGLGCWFYAEYGFDVVVGQCVARVKDGGYMLRFRWGNPYRTTQHVKAWAILGTAEDPRWLSRLARIFKSAKHPNESSSPTAADGNGGAERKA